MAEATTKTPVKNAQQALLDSMPAHERAIVEREIKKRAAEIEAKKAHIRANYPHANADTLTFDPAAKKYKCEVTCPKSGKKHWRFTSDLHQALYHPDVVGQVQKEKKAQRRELIKQLLAGQAKA
jgi:hypothetical protein